MSVLAILLGGALGKLLGFGREVTLAFFFGATSTADAFRAGLAAALFPTHFFMGDVLDGAFVPLYSRYIRTNPASGRRLLRLTATYLLAVSTGLAALTWIIGPQLVRIFAPGLAADTVSMSARMLRWMGLGIPFYCFAALYSLYGICHQRYRPLALRTTFQNSALMLTIPIAAWLHNPEWLGLGFSVAFVIYLAYTWITLRDVRRADAAAAVRQAPDGHELRTLFHTATPLVVTLILGQLLSTIDRAAASFVGVGAVASLEYARAFVETPQVLVGYAVGTVALSRFTALGKQEAQSQAAVLIFPLLTRRAGPDARSRRGGSRNRHGHLSPGPVRRPGRGARLGGVAGVVRRGRVHDGGLHHDADHQRPDAKSREHRPDAGSRVGRGARAAPAGSRASVCSVPGSA